MAAARQPSSYVTPEEYLAFERASPEKHEYLDGMIYKRGHPPTGRLVFGMAGGKPAHNNIADDTLFAVTSQLRARGSGCEANSSDTSVGISDAGPFFYPDMSVVCGDPVYDDSYCLRNPILIAEVLGRSTENYDQNEKFRNYLRLRSLRHYLLIAQDRVHIQHFERSEGGILTLVATYHQRGDTLAIADLGVAIPLADIYRRVPEAPDTDSDTEPAQ